MAAEEFAVEVAIKGGDVIEGVTPKPYCRQEDKNKHIKLTR
jgi:hypothetical protein